jgi:RecJ-like exonuclease
MDCPKCGGSGKIEEDGKQVDCPRCDGTGEVDSADVKEPPKEPA